MKLYLQTKDFTVTKEEFKLKHNLDLDMLVTDPVPDNLSLYYESQDYISHTDAKKTFIDKIYQAVKTYSLNKKVKLITKYSNENKSLLDVGAGTGDFLITAKKNNWNVNGVEPNSKAKKLATEKGLRLFSNLDSLPNKEYDIITLWHVLEHLPDLEIKIRKLKSLLKKDGTLIIAVPNFKSYDAQYYKRFWAAYDVPRHLWHFSKFSIEKLFALENMKVIKTKPMLFDSFYVSLLSEKYKTGEQNIIKAFFIGLLSNMKAIRTKEYSSLLYIIKNT